MLLFETFPLVEFGNIDFGITRCFDFNLIVVLTLRTANQGGNFHNIVVFTQIRGVIRSFWGHNKTHFSFGIGNILPDPLPPHKMFPILNLGMSETPPPLFGPCSQILHIFFVIFPYISSRSEQFNFFWLCLQSSHLGCFSGKHRHCESKQLS